MTSKVKVLITGASGFIGLHLCEQLSNHYEIIGCFSKSSTINISKSYVLTLPSAQFDDIVKLEQPNFVIHCAGGASVSASIVNPEKDFRDNVVVTESVLSSLARYSPQSKVIFLSSAAVYGNPISMPITHSTPINPISPYGFHKMICEQICQKYYQLNHIPAIILRLFSIYGPGLKKQVLWDICQKARTDKVISLFGTGDETRDFLYISDLVKIIENIIKSAAFQCEVINLASGKEVSIKRLVTELLAKMNVTKPVQFSNQVRKGDPIRWIVDKSTLHSFEEGNLVPLEYGLQKYADWLRMEEKR